MDFLEELRAFATAHPEVGHAEIFCVDLNGICRGKLVPFASLKKLATGGMKLPSSTAGLDIFAEDVLEAGLAIQTGDPDGVIVPVLGSLAKMHWADAAHPTAQVQVVPSLPNGDTAPYDPRNVLTRVVDKATERGLTPVMALEQEFFLIDPSEPLPPRHPVTDHRMDQGQVYDLDIMRAFAPVLHRIAEASAALGARAETMITEYGCGQFEVNLMHGPDPVAAADQVIALRRAIRGVARNHGLDATFMAKPWGDAVGSGLHLHLSLLDASGANVFAGNGAPNAAMRYSIAGCLNHMPEVMLIFAPHLNSYRRFVPGFMVGLEAVWALDNRGASVRVPEVSGAGARIEHRVAGADANPYLVAAAILASVLAGLDAAEEPPAAVAGQIGQGMGASLPLNWQSAEQAFSRSTFVKECLGPEFQHVFGSQKRQEHSMLLAKVSDVELETYLRRL